METKREGSRVSEDSIYRTDAGDILLIANAEGQKLVPDFPGKTARMLALYVQYPFDDIGRGHLLLEAQ